MGISAIIGLLARALRSITGTEAGEAWTPLRVGLYSFLGLTAITLVFAWLTGTPLECATANACS